MPNVLLNRYDPDTDLPSLEGKVIFVTGGTAGIGRTTVIALAKHNPSEIYFTGRNVGQAQTLIDETLAIAPRTKLIFVECDFSSLQSVKAAFVKTTPKSLDILVCNAGIMAKPPGLSADGWEIQFAVNHIAHALVIECLLPALQRAAEKPSSDVRVIIVSSLGYQFGVSGGIDYATLNTDQDCILGPWMRYGRSKYANVLYAHEMAKRHPNINTVSVHPGVTATELIGGTRWQDRLLIYVSNLGQAYFTAEEGALNQIWLAAGIAKETIVNGSLYLPVGVESSKMLQDIKDLDSKAAELWEWTTTTLKNV